MERLIKVLKAHKRHSKFLNGYFLTNILEDEDYYEEELELLYKLYNNTDKSLTLTQFADKLCQDY